MSKQDSRTRCESQNKVLNVKIGIPPQCECQNWILNVKIVIIRLSAYVKLGF